MGIRFFLINETCECHDHFCLQNTEFSLGLFLVVMPLRLYLLGDAFTLSFPFPELLRA
jgi:hypothetical protein